MPGQVYPVFKDVADEAGSVADAVVGEGLAAATSAVQDKILRLNRKETKMNNASSVLHLDIKENVLSTWLIYVALFDSDMQDSKLAPRMMQRHYERTAMADCSRGGNNAGSTNTQYSRKKISGQCSKQRACTCSVSTDTTAN